MKHLRTLASAAALLAGCSAAMAADLGSTKDTSSGALNLPANWSGFYGEVGVGPGFVQSKLATGGGSVSLSEKGAEFTARLGYDYRFPNSRLAVGVWGDAGNSFDVNGSVAHFLKLGSQWEYAFGGRGCYDHGNGQVCGLVGAAWDNFNIATSTSVPLGLRYGGSVNVMIAKPVYVGLEITQTDWSTFTPKTLHATSTNTTDAVRIFLGTTF